MFVMIKTNEATSLFTPHGAVPKQYKIQKRCQRHSRMKREEIAPAQIIQRMRLIVFAMPCALAEIEIHSPCTAEAIVRRLARRGRDRFSTCAASLMLDARRKRNFTIIRFCYIAIAPPRFLSDGGGRFRGLHYKSTP